MALKLRYIRCHRIEGIGPFVKFLNLSRIAEYRRSLHGVRLNRIYLLQVLHGPSGRYGVGLRPTWYRPPGAERTRRFRSRSRQKPTAFVEVDYAYPSINQLEQLEKRMKVR